MVEAPTGAPSSPEGAPLRASDNLVSSSRDCQTPALRVVSRSAQGPSSLDGRQPLPVARRGLDYRRTRCTADPHLTLAPGRRAQDLLGRADAQAAMQSNHGVSAPGVLILTRDKAISTLGEALWAAGLDYATVGSWADVRRTLERGRISMAVVDGDLPAAELEHVLAELPHAQLQAVLWLVSQDG